MEKVKLSGKDQLKSTTGDAMYGFSWPQRNYKCTFCTKEFKSAQALGGHMNVHRRDRARLRLQSPSWDSSNPIPNPNPNFSSSNSSSSSSPAAVRFLPYPTNYIYQPSSLISLSSPSRDEESAPLIAPDFLGPQLRDIRMKLSMMGSTAACVDVGDLKGRFAQENGFVRMGLLRDAKEGLDLELRLGQSNY